ncbi:P-loop ATPase, Sll1717 family [Rosistilla oblonga]|uniref:P-loop ATPase, Sll1717 family n=1 Tax=Rosistilla oblonga TaxID=2527990 RepID=UPI003A96CB00
MQSPENNPKPLILISSTGEKHQSISKFLIRRFRKLGAHMEIDLDDETLFGNDAAEDEATDVFNAYFMPRSEVNDFMDGDMQFRFLRAYRGEGKSAIIRHVSHENQLVGIWCAKVTGSAISPGINSSDPNVWNREWQRSILNALAAEIGRNIGFAWSDDGMSLVEEAERSGYKQRSFVSSILSRLKIEGIPEMKEPTSSAHVPRIQRYLEGKDPIWLFVDDIDEDFQNTDQFRQRVSAFFSACRHLVNAIPQLVIRTSIRPNVWRILRAHSESLSKVDQYAIDLNWNEKTIRGIIAKRIEGYLQRNDRSEIISRFANQKGRVWEESLCDLAFENPMEWGFNRQTKKPKHRHPSTVLATLSRSRPRWLIELCRLSTKKRRDKKNVVCLTDITGVLNEFGRERVEDLAAEYRSECPQVQEIINAFADTSEDFSTDQLIRTIKDRVLNGLSVKLASVGTVTKPMQVAGFLYEIGFLTAREDHEDGQYSHYSFAEQPELLHNRTNVDRGLSWEIHPVFRQTLRVRTSSGRLRR